MNPKLLPDELPVLPTLQQLEASEDPERMFEEYETEFYAVLERNRVKFNAAMRRIKACAFLKGAENALNINGYDLHHNCFSWCPAPYWREYWTQKLWPE